MTDAHTASTEITLSFDPGDLSEEEGPKEVTVTATLDHRVQAKAITFRLVVTTTPAASTTEITPAARRDVDYTATMASITIPRERYRGKATIIIDPRERDRDAVGIGRLWP